MAFFKFRKGGDEQPTPAPAPESIEVLRKRARHRLIGASVLVLVVCYALLQRSFAVSSKQREAEGSMF